MSMNEADTRYHLIDPVLRDKGYVSREHITLETVLTPPPVEPSGPKGRRRKGPGRTDYLLCVNGWQHPLEFKRCDGGRFSLDQMVAAERRRKAGVETYAPIRVTEFDALVAWSLRNSPFMVQNVICPGCPVVPGT